MVAKIFLFHQFLDNQIGFDAELFGELFDSDAFGNRDLAIDGRRLEHSRALGDAFTKISFFVILTFARHPAADPASPDGAAAARSAEVSPARAARESSGAWAADRDGVGQAERGHLECPGPRMTGWPGRTGPRYIG